MKGKSFPFTREGLEQVKMSSLERFVKSDKFKGLASIASMIVFNCKDVFAADSGAGWKFVGIAREGLFWIGIFASIYGLYLMVLKKDDAGKKIIVTSVLAYLGSWIIPDIFIRIRDIYSK